MLLNDKGRVLDKETQVPVVGLYTAGWIKRGLGPIAIVEPKPINRMRPKP